MFTAHIDESGCTGFNFSAGSTEWFVVAAVVVRKVNEPFMIKRVAELRQECKFQKLQTFHFAKQNHSQRELILKSLASSPVRAVAVAIRKDSCGSDSFRAVREQMFNYATRLCLERVSWLCRSDASGVPLCDVVFSCRKQMRVRDLRDYMQSLKERDTRIEWASLCPTRVTEKRTESSALLQMADYVASSCNFTLDQSRPVNGYFHHLKPILYSRGGKIFSYGLKLIPPPEATKTANSRVESLPF